MKWRDYVHSDPAVLAGKPVVRGTRLAADFLLDLLASGWTREQVLDGYPQLSDEALSAVIAFAREGADDLREEYDFTAEDFRCGERGRYAERTRDAVPGPSAPESAAMDHLIEHQMQEGERKPRQFGSARGQIRMAEDFDAPLDDFEDYM
jgi:uncharacterized protein (DUF433 family)